MTGNARVLVCAEVPPSVFFGGSRRPVLWNYTVLCGGERSAAAIIIM